MAVKIDYYVPSNFSGEDTAEGLRRYVESELLTISRHFSETTTLELRPIFVEPDKPRAGMLVYADGTTWNPGAGEGVYVRTIAGAWSKL